MADAVLIYGAGGMGREVLAQRRARGLPVTALIDRRAAALGSVDGIGVIDPDEAVRRHAAATVIVALHSFAYPVAAQIDALRAAGFARVQSLWDYCTEQCWAPARGFWLQPGLAAAAFEDDMAAARALLADASSQAIFDQQCRLRFAGDYHGLAVPDPASQYDPPDLPPLPDPLRWVDCGAFDGDTLRALAQRHRFADVLAVEPAPENQTRLRATLAAIGIGRALCAGLGATSGTLRFAAGQGGASHLDPDGDTTITITTLDAECAAQSCNCIKMDIEGAEPEALAGAARVIARDRPRLAISAYHEPDHLWTLLDQIAAWQLDYRFYLRSHGHNGFDTVLYALPA